MKIQVTGEQPVDDIQVDGGQSSRIIDVTAGLVSSVNGQTGAVTGLATIEQAAEAAGEAAETAITEHVADTDPHEDRAYADTTFLPKTGGAITGDLDITGRLGADGVTDWINVAKHGAVGDGTTDDKTEIQAAINACPPGGVVYLEARDYGLSGPLTIPPYVTVAGPMADRDGQGDPAAALLPLPGFTGGAVIDLVDQATGGYATVTRDITLAGVNIDGRLLTSEAVIGIRATGYVHGVQLRDVAIHKVTGHAISLVSNGSGNPYSWHMQNVQLSGSGSVTTWDGFHLIGTDHVLIGCRALGVRGHGFYLPGLANTALIGCRSEWSAKSGFYVTGSYGTGSGSGGLLLDGCSTDRNSEYGVLIDSTGNAPINITGFAARRDGRNGFPGTGGGSFAALRGTGSTTPIIVTGMTCYPGVGDDGLGVNSPERGVSFVSCTYASVEASYLHAATTAFHDGGSNTALYRGVAVGTATGTTAAPTRSATSPATIPGPVTVTQGSVLAVRGTSTNGAFQAQQSGDSQLRYSVNANGDIVWGSGAATGDVTLARGAANRLDVSTADLRIATVGRGLRVAEGSNAKMARATLVAGTVTVANTSITANSEVFLTCQTPGGTPGFLRVSARTAGTSFTILSSSNTDTSVVAWMIVEPS